MLTAQAYARLAPAETYNVSRDGLEGGLSRAVTLLNFPVALAALPLVLLACAALPRRAWLAGGPALALCALTAVPGVVDQGDLDARWVNALPAAGVALALGLAVAAARRAGVGFAPCRPGDPLRVAALAVILLLSLPWLAAEAGFHFPGDVFMGEEVAREEGRLLAAVHLGGHHGTYGALLLVTALALSRVDVAGRVGTWLRLVVALGAGYGAVNMVEDAWHEQLVKRGWVEWKIPPAVVPGARPVWLVVLLCAAVFWVLVSAERDRSAPPALA